MNDDLLPFLKNIARDIIGNVQEYWPLKVLFFISNHSMKYVTLYKIEMAKWAPFTHGPDITLNLLGLLYQVKTLATSNFGEYVFGKFVKHVEFNIVKVPIWFSSLIYGILINQNNDILTSDNEVVLFLALLT